MLGQVKIQNRYLPYPLKKLAGAAKKVPEGPGNGRKTDIEHKRRAAILQ